MIGLYKISGDSMLPSYSCGDFVFIWRGFTSKFNSSDVVVVRHSRFGIIVKRIAKVGQDETLILAGDNRAQSTDSETIGAVDGSQVLGKVLFRIAAP